MPRNASHLLLAPARSSGWRTVASSVSTFAIIAAISAISGAAVSLNLVGKSAPAPSRVAVTAPAPALAAQEKAGAVHAPATANVGVSAAKDELPQPTSVASVPSVPSAPTAAPAAAVQAQPSAAPTIVGSLPVAAVSALATPRPPTKPARPPALAAIPDSELTFAKGYAQRHAAERSALAQTKIEDTKIAHPAAAKAKPRVARATTAAQDQRRVAAARQATFGMFDRFDRSSDQFDFRRHQALAYGEQAPARRSAPPQRAARSGGGFFGGWF